MISDADETFRAKRWDNWAGNQTCRPVEIVHPANEDEVRGALAYARRHRLSARVVGAGHSFSPVCVTDGLIVDLERMSGVRTIDPSSARFSAWAGTTIRALGEPLWAAGLSLQNQGDIDVQRLAGAFATATHGSGRLQQSLSASARGFRMILADGTVREIDADDRQLWPAIQVSLGLLGVVTEIEVQAAPAYGLAERIEYWLIEEILDRWEVETASRRHFSFFWMPASDSPATVFLQHPPGLDMADRGVVKLYDEVKPSEITATLARGMHERVDRAYRVYPDPDFEGPIVSRELEYMVPAAKGREAFLALRSLVSHRYPNNKYPIEVRQVAADQAFLSPFFERDSVSLSICGHKSLQYLDFLADVHRCLAPFEPRPHWGKLHYFDRALAAQTFPRLEDFVRIRRKFDPNGMFLNRSLARLFA
jgi:hypothetical protein